MLTCSFVFTVSLKKTDGRSVTTGWGKAEGHLLVSFIVSVCLGDGLILAESESVSEMEKFPQMSATDAAARRE